MAVTVFVVVFNTLIEPLSLLLIYAIFDAVLSSMSRGLVPTAMPFRKVELLALSNTAIVFDAERAKYKRFVAVFIAKHSSPAPKP